MTTPEERQTSSLEQHDLENGDLYQPSVPVKMRDIIYWTGLFMSFTGLIATGISAIWFPDMASQFTATVLVVANAFGLLASATGVVYRPGAQSDYIARYKA